MKSSRNVTVLSESPLEQVHDILSRNTSGSNEMCLSCITIIAIQRYNGHLHNTDAL